MRLPASIYARSLAVLGLGLLLLAFLGAVYGIVILRGNGQDEARLPPTKGGLEAFEWLDTPQLPENTVSFQNAAGEEVTLSSFKGQVVLLNLWATWCTPCLAELPSLDRLAARFKGKNFRVVAINLDREGKADPAAFFARLGIKELELYRDKSTRVSFLVGAPGLPTSILYDAQGCELGLLAGDAEWDSGQAHELITHVLQGGGKPVTAD